MRRLAPLLLALATAAGCAAGDAGAAAGAGAVQVAFLAGEQVVTAPRPGTTVREAVTALIAGPTPAERARGYRTQVPAGSAIRDVRAAASSRST